MSQEVNNGKVFLYREEFDTRMDKVDRQMEKIYRGIYGDEGLNVRPVRNDIEYLSKRLQAVERLIDRGKWFFIGFGILNSAQLAAWFLAFLQDTQ